MLSFESNFRLGVPLNVMLRDLGKFCFLFCSFDDNLAMHDVDWEIIVFVEVDLFATFETFLFSCILSTEFALFSLQRSFTEFVLYLLGISAKSSSCSYPGEVKSLQL